MNFQPFFLSEKILRVEELSPGYDDHASDVWRVQTDAREVIVRTSNIGDIKDASVFFWSVNRLFGVDPNNVFALEAVNRMLSGFGAFRYPKVLGKYKADTEYLIVELLPGSLLTSLMELPDDELRKFGRNMAKIHGHQYDYVGNPSGTFKVGLDGANAHFIRAMREIVAKFYSDDRKIVDALPEMERAFRDLPAPENASFVLVDIDPTQFLAENGVITGLVDTEAYVIAPRELDFVALEYILDGRSATLVAEGYETVLPMPDLQSVRRVYRYLYKLVDIQGGDDLDDWFSHPIFF